MKLVILLLIYWLSCSLSTISQNVKDYYIVSDSNLTVITKKPLFLDVVDTVNLNRIIYPVSDLLGGLNPSYPMALSVEDISHSYVGCLKVFCALSCNCYNYLVEINDSIIEITDKDQFREIFAPVESKEEALSFAYALTPSIHLVALYNFDFLKSKGTDYKVYRKEIRPTSVKELHDGYEVILFDTYYGYTAYCSELVIFVSKDGHVKLIKNEHIFYDNNFHMIIN